MHHHSCFGRLISDTGCDSNVYLHQLHSLHLTSVFREKLVLLPAFAEMTPEINNLQLPSLVIPCLFASDKLNADNRLKGLFSGSSEASGSNRGRTFVFGSSEPLPSAVTSEESRSRASSSGSLTPPPPPYQDQPETVEPSTADVLPLNEVDNIQSPTSSTSERQRRVVLGHASGPVSYHPGLRPRSQSKILIGVDALDKRCASKGFEELGKSGKQRRIVREMVRVTLISLLSI